MPDQVTEMWVTVAASKTEGGELCEPTTRVFGVDELRALPVLYSLEMGSTYTSWVAFRVDACLGGCDLAENRVLRQEGRVPWPSSGRKDIRLDLDARCRRYECAADQHCAVVSGEVRCVSSPVPGLFDERVGVDRGVPCDRAAPIEDVVEPPDDGGMDVVDAPREDADDTPGD